MRQPGKRNKARQCRGHNPGDGGPRRRAAAPALPPDFAPRLRGFHAFARNRYREGSQNGWIPRIAAADGEDLEVSYTPAPLEVPIVVKNPKVFWATRTSRLRIGPRARRRLPSTRLAPWTRVGGFRVFGGRVLWVDAGDGRIYRMPL